MGHQRFKGGPSMLRERVVSALIFATVIGLRLSSAHAADSAPTARASVLTRIDPLLIDALDRDGRARGIAVLRERADTSGAAALAAKTDKGNYVLQTLRAQADRTQKDLRAYLASQGVQFRAYYVANAISFEAGRDVMLAVAARP